MHSKAGPFVALEVTSSPDAAYLRTYRGRVLRADRNTIEDLHAPGICEALTTTSSAKALASIVGKGIFLYDHEWKKLFEYPYSRDDEGKHRAHLAERSGDVALATNRVCNDRDWTNPLDREKNRWSGTTGVWISYEGTLKRVSIPGLND